MRDYHTEFEQRVSFIRNVLEQAHVRGIVYGNSGGKDCTLVGILCKAACDDTVGVILPCASKRNYEIDTEDALAVASKFSIETRTVDLTAVREVLLEQLAPVTEMTQMSVANIAPRLRMIALYAIAGSENRLVAGTGNRSEAYMGYFTKWGDGAYDFNPIADLTATEIIEFLKFLGAPKSITEKAPSAGLYEGQTDEKEMGVSYASIDAYLLRGTTIPEDLAVIESYHTGSEHKRRPAPTYQPV